MKSSLLPLIKLVTLVEGNSKVSFSIDTTPRFKESTTPFPGSSHFTLDPYLIMPSVNAASSVIFEWCASTWN